MELRKLFEEINHWQKEAFPSADEVSKWNHLHEEIGELRESIKEGDIHNTAEEIADCTILLMGIAGVLGIDFEKAVVNKFKKNKNREWGTPDEFGVVRHIS